VTKQKADPQENLPPQGYILVDPNMLNTQYHNDEINLSELLSVLWGQKKLITLVALTSLIIGTSYSLLSPPVYQSRASLYPTSTVPPIELQTLQFINTKYISEYNPGEFSSNYMYDKLISVIKSPSTKQLFIQKKSWDGFQDTLKIHAPNRKVEHISVSLQANSPSNSTLWLSDYIKHVIDLTRIQLAEELTIDIATTQRRLDIEITAQGDLFTQKPDLEIRKLTEALNMPKKELIHTPGLVELNYAKQLLNSIKVNPDNFIVAKIELETQENQTPIKPKKLLIINISLLFGLMLGCFVALIRTTRDK